MIVFIFEFLVKILLDPVFFKNFVVGLFPQAWFVIIPYVLIRLPFIIRYERERKERLARGDFDDHYP